MLLTILVYAVEKESEKEGSKGTFCLHYKVTQSGAVNLFYPNLCLFALVGI